MFKSYKKFILFSLLIPLPFIIILFALLYIRDPFWFFHKPWFREESFMKDMRMQARGIILHKDFDSVIIGTSMLENTSAKEASEKLGDKWVNLSISGSTFAERFVVLNYLFKHKDIKNIIYSIDIRNLNDTKESENKSFAIVYDDSSHNDFSIYLSKKFIICALTFSKDQKCLGVPNLNFISWHEERKHKFGGIENWNTVYDINSTKFHNNILKANKVFKPNFNVDILEFKIYMEKYLLSIIEKNPSITFHLILPTYSRLAYRLHYEGEDYYNINSELFSNNYTIMHFLVEKTSKYPNVKIYGFDDLNYADDIRNYEDPEHYNIDMNSMQLNAIKNGAHILTPQNIDKYFKTMEEKIRNYDLTPFVKFIKKNESS